MPEHYIREEAKRQQKVGIAKALISRSNSDGTQLETDINKISDPDIKNELKNEKFKKAYNDINKFLKLVSSNPKKLNIKRNINEIIDLLYEYELPMTDVDVGYCMLDTLEVMCETQNRLTMLEDFNIQIPTLDSLYLSYKRFQDKIKIIEYNSKLYKINDNYIESYQRELNSMSLLINKRLLPELKILEEEIKKRDNEDIITKYSNLSLILNNFNDIKNNMDSFYDLPNNIQKYLSNIENYFQNCESTYLEIKQLLDKISLSYRGISKMSGVTWSTFNRYSILKEYIDNRIPSLKCNVDLISNNKLDIITNNYNQLKKEMDYMVDNCLEIGILKSKIKILEEQNKTLLNENTRLKLEEAALSKKNSKALISNINEFKK